MELNKSSVIATQISAQAHATFTTLSVVSCRPLHIAQHIRY